MSIAPLLMPRSEWINGGLRAKGEKLRGEESEMPKVGGRCGVAVDFFDRFFFMR